MALLIDFPEKSKKRITTSIPEGLIKTRPGGGGKFLNYISGATVDDILNDCFNYNWDWEIIDRWIQNSIPFVDKKGHEMPQGPVAHVHGRLTVKFYNDNNQLIEIKKDAFGSKIILGRQSDQESIFKAADTDAIKKAASRLGIGLDLYRNEEEQYYFENSDDIQSAWTETDYITYKKEIEGIQSLREQYNFTDNDLNSFVNEYSSDLYSMEDINPTNIKEFYIYIQNKIKELQE